MLAIHPHGAAILHRLHQRHEDARGIGVIAADQLLAAHLLLLGLKVHEAALEKGVKVVGATAHFVDEGTDTGAIILQKAVEVQKGDTPEVLQRRVMEQAEWKILPQAIDLIANDKLEIIDGKVWMK